MSAMFAKLLANKKALYGIIGAVVILVIIIIVLNNSAAENLYVTAGQKVEVTLTAGEVQDMYGYQFQLNYDPEEFEFIETNDPANRTPSMLTSKIKDVTMIFSKPFDGYRLVGATMVGEKPGFTGKKVQVCQVEFMAKKDGYLPDMSFSLSRVNVVKSDLEYLEDMQDWTFKAVAVGEPPVATESGAPVESATDPAAETVLDEPVVDPSVE